MEATLLTTDVRLERLDRYWRAANYLAAAQLYLRHNPLLRRPLEADDCKRRVLGHWGTVPGLNLIYAHLNRLIADRDLDAMLVVGPGHGAPAVYANLYLEGTLGQTDPRYTRGEDGMQALLRDFSWPGGLPSHLTARTPGTLHEGGELGYALSHAYGIALDDPQAFVACVIGDGEAETGPLAASWLSHAFCDPATSGAVLPILHLNGYKLSAPSVLARMPRATVHDYLCGMGYQPLFVEVDEDDARDTVHAALWRALDDAADLLDDRRRRARLGATPLSPPVLVLVSPKGMTGPRTLDGLPVEGTPRAHGIPVDDPYGNAAHRAVVEQWLRSYRPDELFSATGNPIADVLACLPPPARRLGRNPRANGGNLRVPLSLPPIDEYATAVGAPGAASCSATHALGNWLAATLEANAEQRNLRVFSPDEAVSNKLDGLFDVTARAWTLPVAFSDTHLARNGRVMEMLSEHTCEGWMEGYVLSGRHGLFASYEGFVPIVDSMVAQYAKWLKTAAGVPWRAPVSALNFLMTSHVWRQEHNGYSHQGPGFVNTVLEAKADYVRVYLPPDANSLLCVAEHTLRTTDRINVVVAPKQDAPQWLDLAAARAHLALGAARWAWAADDPDPDVVLGCAGDVMTLETLAAVSLLREHAPSLRLRVVNVVDLFALTSPELHPHGTGDEAFVELFGTTPPVVFAYHGYPRTVHELIYRRPRPERFHVHGYVEEGSTTTPFDMTVLNHASRYDLALDVLRRARERSVVVPDAAIAAFEGALARHAAFIRREGYDLPEVTGWTWRR
ncbi:MAG TPA: phosphoketolase family protein [Candidatus Sulfotelmatobacter sp.]|nr:phosphoketolase family protein [Candidatus Sulfotelmatobacter sp.]